MIKKKSCKNVIFCRLGVLLAVDPLGGQGPRPRVRPDGALLLHPDPEPVRLTPEQKDEQYDDLVDVHHAKKSSSEKFDESPRKWSVPHSPQETDRGELGAEKSVKGGLNFFG